MPKLQGLLEYFPQLSNVEAKKIALYLKWRGDVGLLENKLGNKILYPQTVPVSAEDLAFDLAILGEALRLQPKDYYNDYLRKIYIPEGLLYIFPNLQELAWIFVDVLNPTEITTVLLKGQHVGSRNLGTIIRPEIITNTGSVYIGIGGKKYQIKAGSLTVIPLAGKLEDIQFESQVALLNGKHITVAEVAGGQLGLVVDMRRVK